MKRLVVLTVMILWFKPLLFSQIDLMVLTMQTVNYQYDEVGNRIEKSILLLKSGNADNSNLSDTLIKDQSFDQMDVLIYPNPTAGQISIEIRARKQNFEAEEGFEAGIYDLQGRKVQQKTINEGEMTVIDIGNEPDGLYILMIWNKEVSSRWKVIKR
jgi:hypothetical protein